MKPFQQLLLITAMFVVSVMANGCDGVTGNVSFSPNGIPIALSVNTEGEISFSVKQDVQIPTPLGVLEVGVSVDPAKMFGVQNTLTVRMDGKDYIYDLHGQDFNLKLDSGYYKEIALTKTESNILLELVRIDVESQSSVTRDLPVPVTEADTPPLVVQPVSPEQFIRDYYDIINNRQYEQAWAMLSPAFKENRLNKGMGGFDEFADWWKKVRMIKITLIDVQSQNDFEAYVYVEADYYYESGKTTTGHTTYKLVKNSSGDSWLFDPN